MLTDEVEIVVEAGKGGNGLVAWRREKYVPRGGPDGGDGGDGGNVVFIVDQDTNTLTDFARQKVFRARGGENGQPKRQTGKDGRDLLLKVPAGTLIYEFQGKKVSKIADLTKIGERLVAASGGRGGLGNYHFATAAHQAPTEATPGTPGEKKRLKLELELIAAVGIIGLPNVGKSTLLARISHAHPKIADYPFTTLEPNLGVTKFRGQSFIVADIPGLIEGASAGKGLGDKFLRHIRRTQVLVHLVDALSVDPIGDYQTLRRELKLFDPVLTGKPEVVALSRVDSLSNKDQHRLYERVKTLKPIFLSSVTGRGVNDLLAAVTKELPKQ